MPPDIRNRVTSKKAVFSSVKVVVGVSEQNSPESKVNKEKYLASAIKKIYGDDDDFIVLGLTGRTGSGCSTIADILQSDKQNINHGLYDGGSPATNQDRKDRIIRRFFNSEWQPFLLLQVRSIITTFLLDEESFSNKDFFYHLLEGVGENRKERFLSLLGDLKEEYHKANKGEICYVSFYTEMLPLRCQEIKEILGESSFVRLYQAIGKNIRLSGVACEDQLEEGKFFTLAERVNSVIKRIHDKQQAKSEKTLVVVDAIRNPLEALFFQDRYSSFYLVAVSAPENDRASRLRAQGYSDSDIKSIDDNEYTSRDIDKAEYFSVQDIQGCLQRADIYISNPNSESRVDEFKGLASQVIRFVSLIQRPGLVTPSAIERCMQVAYTAKLNSGCISRQVGAVVTDQNYSIRSVGWNDVPHGQTPCNLRSRDDLLDGVDDESYSYFEKNNEEYIKYFKESSKAYNGLEEKWRNKSFCFKSEYNAYSKKDNQVHTRSLHAEENAFLQVSKYGLSALEGGYLFSTASPCELCSKKAYQLGISKIFYIDPYPGIAVTHVLRGGVKNPDLILFSGAIGRAFHKLYSPVVPYKDELNALASS